jgi:hypothetical protein
MPEDGEEWKAHASWSVVVSLLFSPAFSLPFSLSSLVLSSLLSSLFSHITALLLYRRKHNDDTHLLIAGLVSG